MATGTAIPIYDGWGTLRHEGEVFYRIQNYPAKPGSLSPEKVRQKLALAFRKWELISNFRFTDATDDRRSDRIDIEFQFGDSGFGRLAKCDARLPSGTKTIVFDDDVVWTDLSQSPGSVRTANDSIVRDDPFVVVITWFVGLFDGKSDLLTVACHEIGHALGLEHD